MHPDLKLLITILVISILVGLLLGISLRKLKPSWCKAYSKYCLNRKWRLFAFGVVVFAAMSILTLINRQPYLSTFFALFSAFELYAMFKCGFNTLTSEQEEKIDRSDPTILWSSNEDTNES